jgi:phenylacetate-CoA ligase
VGELPYKVDRVLNYWYLSPFDINQKNLDTYIKFIKKSGAKLLRGYPSSIYILTLLLKENNIKLPQIQTLFTSSENLLPNYKKTIEDYWQVPLIDWYGQNERTVTVQMCEYGTYHNNDEYGIVELDARNQILATSLNNNVMPLIRYATNDLAIPTLQKNCKCGRGLSIPFEGIDGRADDLLVKEDGTIIATVNIYNAMEKFQDVKQFKILQQLNKSIELTLSENKPLTSSYINAIEVELRQRLGNVKIKVSLVKEIERDRNTEKIKSIQTLIKI